MLITMAEIIYFHHQVTFCYSPVISSCSCACHLPRLKGTLFFLKIHPSEFSGPGEALLHSLHSVVPHRNGDLVDKLIVIHFAIWFDICFLEKIIHCNKSH